MTTTRMLLADQGSATIPGSSRVLLLSDTDGNGTIGADERSVFFDGSNRSGLTLPTENVFTVHQAADGSVFIGDGTTDSIYRLFDANGDGDANDRGEAVRWLGSRPEAGQSLVTPNGIAQGPDGALYVTNAGTGSVPQDAIYRSVDLDGDGRADGVGETTLWADLQGVVATSVPFDITFIGNAAYVTDLAGAAEDIVHRLEDLNGDGRVDRSEITTFARESAAFGAPLDIAADAQGDSLLTFTWVAAGGEPHRLYRLTDLNGNGTIDAASESVEVWNSTRLPEGFGLDAGFSISTDGAGRVALAVNGGDPGEKNVFLLEDRDGDGSYLDDGETTVFATNANDPGGLYRPRAVEFYDEPVRPVATQRDDVLMGSFADDTLSGKGGDDVIVGGAGDDVLNGVAGNDRLFGGQGADRLVGGAGDDTLFGGAGADRLKGDAGRDVFAFSAADGTEGRDTVLDFQDGVDQIALDGLDLASVRDIRAGALVTFSNGATVLLSNVDAASIDADDFTDWTGL